MFTRFNKYQIIRDSKGHPEEFPSLKFLYVNEVSAIRLSENGMEWSALSNDLCEYSYIFLSRKFISGVLCRND